MPVPRKLTESSPATPPPFPPSAQRPRGENANGIMQLALRYFAAGRFEGKERGWWGAGGFRQFPQEGPYGFLPPPRFAFEFGPINQKSDIFAIVRPPPLPARQITDPPTPSADSHKFAASSNPSAPATAPHSQSPSAHSHHDKLETSHAPAGNKRSFPPRTSRCTRFGRLRPPKSC